MNRRTGAFFLDGVSQIKRRQECLQDQAGDWGWQVVEQCASGLCMGGICIGACDSDLKLNTYLGCNYYTVDLDNIEGGMTEPVGVVVSAPEDGLAAEIEVLNLERASTCASRPAPRPAPERNAAPTAATAPAATACFTSRARRTSLSLVPRILT